MLTCQSSPFCLISWTHSQTSLPREASSDNWYSSSWDPYSFCPQKTWSLLLIEPLLTSTLNSEKKYKNSDFPNKSLRFTCAQLYIYNYKYITTLVCYCLIFQMKYKNIFLKELRNNKRNATLVKELSGEPGNEFSPNSTLKQEQGRRVLSATNIVFLETANSHCHSSCWPILPLCLPSPF